MTHEIIAGADNKSHQTDNFPIPQKRPPLGLDRPKTIEGLIETHRLDPQNPRTHQVLDEILDEIMALSETAKIPNFIAALADNKIRKQKTNGKLPSTQPQNP